MVNTGVSVVVQMSEILNWLSWRSSLNGSSYFGKTVSNPFDSVNIPKSIMQTFLPVEELGSHEIGTQCFRVLAGSLPPPLGLSEDGSWVLSTSGKNTVATEDEKLP